jgi:general nucleoside transport system permease protein
VDDFLTLGLLWATLRAAAPLLLTALGGLLSERSGVVNIGLEGLMLIGAFGAAVGSYYSGDALVGLLVGTGCALALGLVHAVWCISLRGDQIVAGTAINILGVAIPAYLSTQLFETSGRTPDAAKLYSFGNGIHLLVPVAFILVPVVWWYLARTRSGLRLMAAGEDPRAAESVGIPVTRTRYVAVLVGAVLGGLGGACLSLGDLSFYTNEMTQGRGFIALAAVIFGNWTPVGTLVATLLFGGAQAVQTQAQSAGLPINTDLLLALPYLLTLVAITGLFRKSIPPAGLGRHAS